MVDIINTGPVTVYGVDAPNWPGLPNTETLKIGVTKESLAIRAHRGLRHLLGQFYGVVDPGLITAAHVFKGLNRAMQVGNDADAAGGKLAVTWSAPRDAELVGDKANCQLAYSLAPESKVFVVYISTNQMLSDYPSIYGWAEHWTWLQADPVLSGAPIEWKQRYDSKLWSAVP